jgi:hypothetical protein
MLVYRIAGLGTSRRAFADMYDPEGQGDVVFGGLELSDTRIIVEPAGTPKSMLVILDDVLETLDGMELRIPDLVRPTLESLTVKIWGIGDDERRAKMLFGDIVHQNLRTIVLTDVHPGRGTEKALQCGSSPAYIGFEYISSHPEQFPVLENLSVRTKWGPAVINIRSRTLRQIQLPVSAELVTIDCPGLELISHAIDTVVELVDGTDPATIELYASGLHGCTAFFEHVASNARHLIIGPGVEPIHRLTTPRSRREPVHVDSVKLKSFYRAGARSELDDFCFAAPNLEEMWIG